jgi:hypothetical protein
MTVHCASVEQRVDLHPTNAGSGWLKGRKHERIGELSLSSLGLKFIHHDIIISFEGHSTHASLEQHVDQSGSGWLKGRYTNGRHPHYYSVEGKLGQLSHTIV